MYDTRDGVGIAKFVREGGAGLEVGVHVRSRHPDATFVAFRDPLPASVPVEALAFDSDRWTVEDDSQLRWSGVVEGSLVATYECPLPLDVGSAAFHGSPFVDRVGRAVYADGGTDAPRARFSTVREHVDRADLDAASAADCEAQFGTRLDAVSFATLLGE